MNSLYRYCTSVLGHRAALLVQRAEVRSITAYARSQWVVLASQVSINPDRMKSHTRPLLNLANAAPDIIPIIIGSLPLRERFNCALVCKAWAEAATAATHSIILKHKVQDVSGLQHWLEKHGNMLEVLQLHAGYNTALTAMACCAKLQDLLLHGLSKDHVSIGSRTWGNIASATKLTSISLSYAQTASQQADVVSALTALPNLEQLTWNWVYCDKELWLSNSSLLQCTTRLTLLDLHFTTAAALQHLGSLTKLQHLSLSAAQCWAAAGCPGLQELTALTSLKLASSDQFDLPTSASQLTALRQVDVHRATPTALNRLQVLTGLTQLCVRNVTGLSSESPPLQLPVLQHLELEEGYVYQTMHMSFLASCTQLRFLKVQGFNLEAPGSLLASTVLQHLELHTCSVIAADGAADPVSWQQVFPGPGRLPHLTCLKLQISEPALQQADIEAVVACCSSLQVLHLDTLQDSAALAVAQLPGLTNLHLDRASDELCSALVQLTGLRQLIVRHPWELMMSAVGLRQLVALQQLTSLGFGTFIPSVLNKWAHCLMKDTMPGCTFAITNKAPSGSPPDVVSQLLHICDVLDVCEGLSIEAVIEAARKLMQNDTPGRSGDGHAKPLTAEACLAAAAALKAGGAA